MAAFAGRGGMILAVLVCVGELSAASAFSPAGATAVQGVRSPVPLAASRPGVRVPAPRAARATALLGAHMQWGARARRDDFGPAGRGGNAGQVPRNDRKKAWERGDDGTMPGDVDEGLIFDLLADREKAKRRKEFAEADRLRDVLLRDHMIHVDDRRRLWWPEGARPRAMSAEEEMSLSGGMGGGAVTASDAPGQVLTFGWKRGTPHQEVAPVDERRIYDKLGERQDARRAKDFDLADDIMDELTQLGVGFLDDREMTWFAAAPPLDAPQNQQQGPAGLAWGPDNNLGKRAGDWSCPECGANVFASKMECYRCSCPRPGGTAGEGDGTRPLAGERAGRGAWAGASTAASDTASGRGGQGATGARRFAPFARMPSDRTEVDEEAVLALLDEREDARRRRDYGAADGLREELQLQYGVAVDDDTREWWVGDRKDNRDRKFGRGGAREQARGGVREQAFAGRTTGRGGGASRWARADFCSAPVDSRVVETLIDARDSARRVRDFDTADDVREVLMQDWGVALDDDARLWWVGPRNDARLANFGNGQGGGAYGRGNYAEGGYGGGGWGDGGRGAQRAGGGRAAAAGRRDRVPFSEPFRRSSHDQAPVDENAVDHLLSQREEARKRRDYRSADALRDALTREHGVTVDDDMREWWCGHRQGNRVRKFNNQMRGDVDAGGSSGTMNGRTTTTTTNNNNPRGSWGQYRGGGYERNTYAGRRALGGRGGGRSSGRSRDMEDFSRQDLGWE